MSVSKAKRSIVVFIKKATDSKQKPSKEKHVRSLVLQTFAPDSSCDEIIKALERRMEKQNWAIVVKCLMIFHRLFRDGDPKFLESIKSKSNQVFALRRFTATAPTQHIYTQFVKKYAKYLEEKVSVYRLLGYQFEKNKGAVEGLKIPHCFKVVPKLQSQINALLNCKMRGAHVGTNQLIHRTYILLMKDSLSLYSMLNEGIQQLLNMFWHMGKSNATKVLNIYKLFCKETDALISLYEIGKTFIRQLPEINPVETGIIDSMDKYIEGQQSDSASEKSGEEEDKQKTKKDKKKKNPIVEESELEERPQEGPIGAVPDSPGHQEESGSKDDESEGDDSSSEEAEDDKAGEEFFKDFLASLGPVRMNTHNFGQQLNLGLQPSAIKPLDQQGLGQFPPPSIQVYGSPGTYGQQANSPYLQPSSFGQGSAGQGPGTQFGQGLGGQGLGNQFGQGPAGQGPGTAFGQGPAGQGPGTQFGQGLTGQVSGTQFGQGPGNPFGQLPPVSFGQGSGSPFGQAVTPFGGGASQTKNPFTPVSNPFGQTLSPNPPSGGSGGTPTPSTLGSGLLGTGGAYGTGGGGGGLLGTGGAYGTGGGGGGGLLGTGGAFGTGGGLVGGSGAYGTGGGGGGGGGLLGTGGTFGTGGGGGLVGSSGTYGSGTGSGALGGTVSPFAGNQFNVSVSSDPFAPATSSSVFGGTGGGLWSSSAVGLGGSGSSSSNISLSGSMGVGGGLGSSGYGGGLGVSGSGGGYGGGFGGSGLGGSSMTSEGNLTLGGGTPLGPLSNSGAGGTTNFLQQQQQQQQNPFAIGANPFLK